MNLINYTKELIEIVANHGWVGFLSIAFVFLIFILFFVKIQSTFLYGLFVFFNTEKKRLRKIKSIRKVSNNKMASNNVRELAKHDETQAINSSYLKCNLSVNTQIAWAKLINFHKDENILFGIYKRAYPIFPLENGMLSEKISSFDQVRVWIVTIFQFLLLLFVVVLGALAIAASLGILGGDNIKVTLFFFFHFIVFACFLSLFSSGIPNYFGYRKVKKLINEYNQAH